MFYFKYKGKKITDINQLTLREVQELLDSIKDLKLKWEPDKK